VPTTSTWSGKARPQAATQAIGAGAELVDDGEEAGGLVGDHLAISSSNSGWSHIGGGMAWSWLASIVIAVSYGVSPNDHVE